MCPSQYEFSEVLMSCVGSRMYVWGCASGYINIIFYDIL